MLPEKKKRLIIGIIAIIICIVVVICLWKLSAFIKSRNEEYVKNNSEYSKNYDYFGVLKDTEGIYRLYGINNGEEVYLSLKTFYEVKDILIKDKRLILYSDAVNEVRYDKDINEYYFYELDSYYNNKEYINLAKDYIITYKDKIITYWKYGMDDKKKISSVDNYIVYENMLYYITNGRVMQYNLDKSETMEIVEDNLSNIKLLGVNENYLFYEIDSVIYVYKLKNKYGYNLSEMVNGSYMGLTKTDILLNDNNRIINYEMEKNKVLYSYDVSSEVERVINLENSIFYFQFRDKCVIIDMDKGNILYELENSYLYLVKVV